MSSAPSRDRVFRAVADPTRRAILGRLAEEERAVGELVEAFPISQPAMSQHLRVLRRAGLVSQRRRGRFRIYRLNAGPIREVYDWAGHYRRFWQDKLAALGEYLDAEGEEP